MDQVFIKDLLARGIIGLNDWEREKEQDVLVNVTLFTPSFENMVNDDLSESVNYRTIAKNILSHISTSKRFTVEALANDLAKICLEDPKVVKVILRVEKPAAVRFSKSVGVEIERSKGA